MQARLWMGVATCVAMAVASGLAERRRARRRDLDRVGMIAWPTVQLMGIVGAVILASVAISA